MRATQSIAACIIAAGLLSSNPTLAACNQASMAGRWWLNFSTMGSGGFIGYARLALIDNVGRIDGLIKWMDDATPYPFSIKSVTPFKINADCSITDGIIKITYGAAERKVYGVRGALDPGHNNFAGAGFNHPGPLIVSMTINGVRMQP